MLKKSIAFLFGFSSFASANTLQNFMPNASSSSAQLIYNHADLQSTSFTGQSQTHYADSLNLDYQYGFSETSAISFQANDKLSILALGYMKKFESQTNTIYLSSVLNYYVTAAVNQNTEGGWIITRTAPSSAGITLKSAIDKDLGSTTIGFQAQVGLRPQEIKSEDNTPSLLLGRVVSNKALQGLISVYAEYNNDYKPNLAIIRTTSYSFINPEFRNTAAYAAFDCEIQGVRASARLLMNDQNSLELIPNYTMLQKARCSYEGSQQITVTKIGLNLKYIF